MSLLGEPVEKPREVVRGASVLLFSDALANLVEAVAHYRSDAEEVVCWTEAAYGEVAL